MTEALTERALKYACQRVEDFAVVNQGRPLSERQAATIVWLEYLGVDESLVTQFAQWLDRFFGEWDGGVMVGFAVGMLVNQYQRENPTADPDPE